MITVIITGVFTLAGVSLGNLLSALHQRRAERAAARAKAADLFTQVVRGIGLMETEQAVFLVRRSSWRANFVATGSAVLHLFAAKEAGNWITGAASGIEKLAAWDAAEGARFTERYPAAAADVISALVQLSLLSDDLEKTANDLGDALHAAMSARKPGRDTAATHDLREATAALRTSVRDYMGGSKHRNVMLSMARTRRRPG